MKLIKKIRRFIKENFRLATIEEQKEFNKRNHFHNNKRHETTYNPATGLPMAGGVDVSGNVLGSSSYNSHVDR